MDVLLVEDEPLVRGLLAEDMADAGLDVAERRAPRPRWARPPPPERRVGLPASS